MKSVSVSTLLTILLAGSLANAKTLYFNTEVSKSSVDSLVNQVSKLRDRGERDITVSFESGGGDLQAALRGFQRLREMGVDTHANGECASSCTVLYAAGKHRSAGGSARFMFHGVGIAGKNSKLSKSEREYYAQLFSGKWLAVVRSVDSYLAHELEKDRVLLKGGERWYSARSLRRSGYVNE